MSSIFDKLEKAIEKQHKQQQENLAQIYSILHKVRRIEARCWILYNDVEIIYNKELECVQIYLYCSRFEIVSGSLRISTEKILTGKPTLEGIDKTISLEEFAEIIRGYGVTPIF